MQFTQKFFHKRYAFLLFMMIISNSSIILTSQSSNPSFLICKGFEIYFTDPGYVLYSDKDAPAFISRYDGSNPPRLLPPVLFGRTQLHCAKSAWHAHKTLKYGADINAQDNNGCTPLGYMYMRKQTTIARYLEKNGAKLSTQDKKYIFQLYKAQILSAENALHCATSIEEIKELLDCGANINARDKDGFTVIQKMIMKKSLIAALYLLKNKATISDHDKKLVFMQYNKLSQDQKKLFTKEIKRNHA